MIYTTQAEQKPENWRITPFIISKRVNIRSMSTADNVQLIEKKYTSLKTHHMRMVNNLFLSFQIFYFLLSSPALHQENNS
jgi:hypothetical protein